MNSIVYFYAYFTAEMILVYINSYLPLYFSELQVDTTQLSIIFFFSYLFLFSRVAISVYFDRKNAKRKPLIIFSSFGIILSFTLLILTLNLLFIFGIFLGFIFAFVSVITVGINKIMIIQSLDIKTKNKNALLIQLGAINGSLIPIILFLINTNLSANWNQFFIFGILLTTPILIFVFLLKDEDANYKFNSGNNQEFKNVKKSIVLMCIFLFLACSDRLFSFSIKPWIAFKSSITFFSLIWFVLTLIYVSGNFCGGIILKRVNRKHVLIISTVLIGIILFFAPFIDFFIFLIFYGLYFFISGILLISLLSIMMELSQNKVFYYQLMALFSIAANVVFTPLGTYLFNHIDTEIIIMIAGILIMISTIPVCFIKENINE
ncbi:MAG: hypothetical protein ACFFAQ_09510 [Promethearchaeota archaeon]